MKQSFGIIIILLLVALSAAYFGTWPAYDKRDRIENDLKKTSDELDNLLKKRSLVSQLEAAQPTLGERSKTAQELVPTSEQRETYISEIDSIAKATGVQLISFSYQAARKAKVVKEEDDELAAADAPAASQTTKKKTAEKPLNFRVALVGPYTSIMNFIGQLERAKRYTKLTTFDMAAGLDPNLTSVTLEGSIFSKAAPKIPTDMKFSSDAWDYLALRQSPPPAPPGTGRPDPFIGY